MWKKESSGYVLADIEDRRDTVVMDKGDSFGAVDDD